MTGNPNKLKKIICHLQEHRKEIVSEQQLIERKILERKILNNPIKALQKSSDNNQKQLNKLNIPYLESQMLTQKLQFTLPLVTQTDNIVTTHQK